MKVFCLQFGFVIFWRKDFGVTAAHKMLVSLTPGGRNWQLISPHRIKYGNKSFIGSAPEGHQRQQFCLVVAATAVLRSFGDLSLLF
jgi:hypothetical protein